MKFAINKTASTLDLRHGRTIIPPYGYAKASQSDLEHPHFEDAEVKGWIEYSDVEPVTGHVQTLVQVEEANPFEGLTEEQLLAERDSAAAAKQAEKDAERQALEDKENAEKAKDESNVDTVEPHPEYQPAMQTPTTESITEPDSAVEAAPKKRGRKAKVEGDSETEAPNDDASGEATE